MDRGCAVALEVFAEVRGKPRKIERSPLTARVTKIDAEGGIWAAPVGGDHRTPVGPCRGSDLLKRGDVVLIVWTQERPWVLAGPDASDLPTPSAPVDNGDGTFSIGG